MRCDARSRRLERSGAWARDCAGTGISACDGLVRVGWATFRSKCVRLMASVPALADLLSTQLGFVSAVTGDVSNGVEASRLPSVQLALLVLLTGFAGLIYADPLVWLYERLSSRIDTPSLILIVIVSFLCLLASLWAAFSGVDLSATVP